MNSYIYGQLILNRGAKVIQWGGGEDQSSANGTETMTYPNVKI